VTTPDFDELVGEVEPGERERLMRTHELLIAAGPPPELSPALRLPPGAERPAEVQTLPRRRLAASVVLAAALVLAAFGAGFLVGHRGGDEGSFAIDFVLPMQGTAAAHSAFASLAVGEKDDDGNWPMAMTVRGLPPLPEGERYELLLTRDGRLAVSCGTFRIENAKTVAYLNAPYELRTYDGWVVTRENSDEILLRTEKI
jgi:hypothetical protein